MKRAIAPTTALIAWASVLVQMVMSVQHDIRGAIVGEYPYFYLTVAAALLFVTTRQRTALVALLLFLHPIAEEMDALNRIASVLVDHPGTVSAA